MLGLQVPLNPIYRHNKKSTGFKFRRFLILSEGFNLIDYLEIVKAVVVPLGVGTKITPRQSI